MSAVYRTTAAGPTEEIVLGTPPRWWALILAVPFLLTWSRSFMRLVAPLPDLQPAGDGLCTTPPRNYDAYMAAMNHALMVRGVLFLVALGAVVFALTSLRLWKTVIVIDRGARILRVKTKAREWGVAFGDRPVLVERDGAYTLHAGTLGPITIAPRGAPRDAIDRLRAVLSTLA